MLGFITKVKFMQFKHPLRRLLTAHKNVPLSHQAEGSNLIYAFADLYRHICARHGHCPDCGVIQQPVRGQQRIQQEVGHYTPFGFLDSKRTGCLRVASFTAGKLGFPWNKVTGLQPCIATVYHRTVD